MSQDGNDSKGGGADRSDAVVEGRAKLLHVAYDELANSAANTAALALGLRSERRRSDESEAIVASLSAGDVVIVLVDLGARCSSAGGARALLDLVTAKAPEVPIILLGDPEDPEVTAAARQPGVQDCLDRGHAEAGLLARVLKHALEQRRLVAALRDSEDKHRRLMAISPDAILICSQGRFVALNDPARRLLGAAEAAQLVDQPMVDFFHPTEWRALQTDADKSAVAPKAAFARRKLIRLDGTPFDAWVAASACRQDGDPAVQLVARLVSEDAQVDQHLSYLAQYDLLTRLPNRSQFRDRLIGAMARARRNRQLTAVLFINVDEFERVNTDLGQAAGDQVLEQLADRFQRCTRASDTVARLGGDEFALTLEGLAQKEGAIVVAQRVLAAMSQPFLLDDGRSVQITASIGIAVYPLDADDLDRLWRQADVAMEYAKQQGRNNHQFYLPEIEAQSRRGEMRRLEIEQNLKRLTEREQEVLEMLVTGKANKMVAYLLGISPRTIENHRARIMEKMQANSLPELVRMVLDARQRVPG